VFKDPITDPGKNSKHGRLALVEPEPGEFHTMENVASDALNNEDRLVTVFENGSMTKEYGLDSIRQRAEVFEGTP
jgi:nicotinamide phosphoribosyltransferase